MLYNYNEVLKKYGNDYNIKKALEKKELFKIEKGIYSDIQNIRYLQIISKKYPYAVISGHSAYYYHNLTDIIPRKIVLSTNRHSTRINNPKINQIFLTDDLFELGIITMKYEGTNITIYDKERLLIDLARNKNQMRYDLYKEIVANYREIVDSINMRKIEEYLPHFPNSDKLLEILQNEVF